MENSTINEEELLDEINNAKAVTMVPVMVFLALLMFMGILGNVLVCYFYLKKSGQSSNTVFIIAVSVYDLILCTVSIPIEIVDIRLFYLFTNSPACKIGRFLNTFGAIGSVFTLLIIAVDRYRKICRPFKKQFGLKEARISIVLSVFVSMVVSWPALVFYKSVSVEIVTDDGIILHGSDCTTTRDESYKIYLWIFNAFFAVCFVVSSIVLSVVYSLVGRVIFKNDLKRQRYSSRPISESLNIDKNIINDVPMTLSEPPKEKGDPKKYIISDISPKPRELSENLEISSANTTTRRLSAVQNKTGFDLRTLKYTRMMLVITVVFILSFLPHLILIIWRAFQTKYEGESMRGFSLVAFNIGIRSYFINSAINPLTYGFYNPRFRQFFCQRFCPCQTKYTENAPSTSSGGSQK